MWNGIAGLGTIIALALWAGISSTARAQDFPPVSNLVYRVIERAQLVAETDRTNRYTYDKRSMMVELDDRERVVKSTEKLYKVVLIGGLPFPRLVKIQGRDLTPQQLERENNRETAFRQRITQIDLNKKAEKKEGLATEELANRFDFKITRREMIEGRATLIVTFAPKSDAREKSMEEKIFKHLSGIMWVDEAEAELVKLDANVTGPVPLGWFGAIGSLTKLHAVIERSRMPDGVWVNRKSTFLLIARRLWTAMRFKTTEESSGFRRE
jgi:hypothetical protein